MWKCVENPFGEGMSHDLGNKSVTTGWRQSCSCPPAEPIPCTVLDPFAGTFTVGVVAIKHRRYAIGIELNPKYIELAKERCSKVQVKLL
jgi:hypothetical protein